MLILQFVSQFNARYHFALQETLNYLYNRHLQTRLEEIGEEKSDNCFSEILSLTTL